MRGRELGATGGERVAPGESHERGISIADVSIAADSPPKATTSGAAPRSSTS